MDTNNFHINKFESNHFKKYVECIKIYDFNNDKPILLNPEGCFEMIFQLDNSFYNETSTTNGWEARPNNFLGGLHNKAYHIKSENKKAKLISIQFKQDCAKHFIPDKLTLFKNKIIGLNEVYHKSALEPIHDLRLDKNVCQNLKEIDSFLGNIFNERKTSPIDLGIQTILKNSGLVSISMVARKVGLSNAQFRKRFNEEIGMSPKEYYKIVRINKAIQRLAINPKIKLTELTYLLGYFDQSHFIKDFKSIMGLSPKKHLMQE